MAVLRLFGEASLEADDGPCTGPVVQRHRIALLALLATARSSTMSREKLMALLWPERDSEHARRLLNQSIYVLRGALGDDAILTAGESLRLQPDSVRCDVIEFSDAVASGRFEAAAAVYVGPFLDGFFLDGSAEFERWLSDERARLADEQARVLDELAVAAETRGELGAATALRKSLVALDPYDSRKVLQLMQTLTAAGDPAGALRRAAAHERLLVEELGVGLPPEIGNEVARLRSSASKLEPAYEVRAVEAELGGVSVDDTAPPQRTPHHASTPRLDIGARAHIHRGVLYGSIGLVAALVVGIGLLWQAQRSPGEVAKGDPGGERTIGQQTTFATGRPAAERTTSIAAYELYRKGTDPIVLRNDAAAYQAREYLRQAVALDPSYAAAWAALAQMSWRLGSHYGRSGTTARAEQGLAMEAARRAVTLDDSMAEGHATLGVLQLVQFDFRTAEASLDRAVTLDPSSSRSRQWRIGVYLWTARPAEALAEAETAAALDPLSASAQAEVARALGANGRCKEALARLDRVAAIEPPLLRIPIISAQCKAQLDMRQEAIADLRNPGPLDEALRGHLLARAGAREEAQHMLDGALERWPTEQRGAFTIAAVKAGLGEVDGAIEWLEHAFEDGSLQATNDHFTVLQSVLDVLVRDPRIHRFEPLAPVVALRERQLASGG